MFVKIKMNSFCKKQINIEVVQFRCRTPCKYMCIVYGFGRDNRTRDLYLGYRSVNDVVVSAGRRWPWEASRVNETVRVSGTRANRKQYRLNGRPPDTTRDRNIWYFWCYLTTHVAPVHVQIGTGQYGLRTGSSRAFRVVIIMTENMITKIRFFSLYLVIVRLNTYAHEILKRYQNRCSRSWTSHTYVRRWTRPLNWSSFARRTRFPSRRSENN